MGVPLPPSFVANSDSQEKKAYFDEPTTIFSADVPHVALGMMAMASMAATNVSLEIVLLRVVMALARHTLGLLEKLVQAVWISLAPATELLCNQTAIG